MALYSTINTVLNHSKSAQTAGCIMQESDKHFCDQ